jgi:dienelactone hydrolase
MVNQVKSNYSVDNDRVFVTGLSAGGAMTSVLGATYPDVFKAIGVGAGLMYKAATDMTGAFSAMSSGSSNSPITTAKTAYNAMGTNKAMVPTIVFHGTSDGTVAPKNGDQVITQFAEINDLVDDGVSNDSVNDVADLTESGQVASGRAFTRTVYNDKDGNTLLEKYMVTSMGHAWSGGNTAGSYTDPKGPKQSQITWDFFKTVTTPKAPVTTPSPKAGKYLLSTTVALNVSKEATTYYTLNGTTPTTSSAVYTAPINITADTTIKFFSVDTKGNVEAVQSAFYDIESLAEHKTPPVTTASVESGAYTTAQTVTLTTDEQATTYYTVDGTTPTTSSAKYTAPITISNTTTLKFFSVDIAGNAEAVQTKVYEMINYDTATGTATEHYTAGRLDAAGYTQMGTKYGYVNPFNLYKVFGTTTWTDVKPNGGQIPVDTTAPVTTTNPAAGTYATAQNVTLTANEAATTYYTVNGSTPTTASTKYTAPIAINATTTLKFFSVDAAGNVEAVKTATYTIQSAPVDTTAPVTTSSLASGTYTSAQTVTLTANEAATTYYTVNGTTPTTSSTVYTAPIAINTTTTLKFFSVDAAGNAEAVKTATYTINVAPTYETATATVTNHYIAGRLNVTQYNQMGIKYGYNTVITLYKVQGSTTWTDVQPQ